LENDPSWNAQFFWWNAETIGNYYDGLFRYGFLLEDEAILRQATAFVEGILRSQDDNGYLGIYTKEFRYRFASENGELWAKTTIGRCLLGHYRYTKDERSFVAVERMTDELMNAWPIDRSTPFGGENTFAGVAHGLMFVDVLYELFRITNQRQYIEYALFLYEDYNLHEVSEPDCLIRNLLDSNYRFKGHGVHTYEHLRAIAIYDAFSGKSLDLVSKYMQKLTLVLSPSGGPIGDEWIMGNLADADAHGYEFCSIHELMSSLLFVSKLGLSDQYALAKRIFLNANLGSHHHQYHTIAYLKSDNSYAMEGCFHVSQPHSPHKIQTRYKYSPTHRDAAVCCVPNAVRIMPYFLEGIATLHDDHVVLNILAPIDLTLTIDDQPFYLRVDQQHPYDKAVVSTDLGDRLIIREAAAADLVECKVDQQGNVFFEANGIVFAYPILSVDRIVMTYPYGLNDIHVSPLEHYVPLRYQGDPAILVWKNERPEINVRMDRNGVSVDAVLIPVGETVLRQVTFETI
jgi:hypothetical protein